MLRWSTAGRISTIGSPHDLLGIRTEIEGAIPPGPYLIAVKHQSMFETIEMLLFARVPIIVMKRELADLPLFGRLTRRYGVIPVDREAGAKALREMLADAKAAKATGRPVVIYPEGTRVAPGTSPPLRAGFRWPVSGARPAGGAGRAGQRSAVAAWPAQAQRNHPLQGRRGHSGRD